MKALQLPRLSFSGKPCLGIVSTLHEQYYSTQIQRVFGSSAQHLRRLGNWFKVKLGSPYGRIYIFLHCLRFEIQLVPKAIPSQQLWARLFPHLPAKG